MDTIAYNYQDLYQKGLKALSDSLGTSGMIRFLEILNKAHGDYTQSKYEIADDESVDDIANAIYAKRNKK